MFTWRIETAEPGSVDALAAFGRTTPQLRSSLNIATALNFPHGTQIAYFTLYLSITSCQNHPELQLRHMNKVLVLLLPRKAHAVTTSMLNVLHQGALFFLP